MPRKQRNYQEKEYQQPLLLVNNSEDDNKQARAECKALLTGGYGQLPDYVKWLEKQ